MSSAPHQRPSAPDDLGFDPQRPVVWLSPTELVQTAKKLTISKVFGDYADKRELIGALPDPGIHDYSDRTELWIDYVADLGDGFDATYSVASLLASEKLDLTEASRGGALTTRRADVLVMGGDEVYPAASISNYEDRTIGPYRAAFPHCESDSPDLFAVPGNHDWYDGLTAWMRMFAQRKHIGGWQTHQSRSYFALRLPHRWWLWGIDVQFNSYIDAPQLDYFHRVVTDAVEPGDEIILCAATPEWVNSHRNDPESFRTLDYFEREIIAPSGAKLRLAISGDAHHYAHYVSEQRDLHRLTSGGGGAYLSATHGLPDRLALPPEASKDRRKTTPAVPFHRRAEYPDQATSRRLGRGVWLLPLRNPSFTAVTGTIYAVFAWTSLSITTRAAGASSPQGLWRTYVEAARTFDLGDAILGLVGRPLSLLVSIVLAIALFGLTKRHGPRRLLTGSVHLAVQAAALVASLTISFGIAGILPGWAPLPFGVALAFGLGAVVGPLVLAGYLCWGDAFGRNVNEQFSSMRIEGYKNFIRLHLGPDGVLTIHPIGLREVVRSWRINADDRPAAPWLVPDDDVLTPELIEEPIRLEHRRAS